MVVFCRHDFQINFPKRKSSFFIRISPHRSLFLMHQLTVAQHWFGSIKHRVITWTSAALFHRRVYDSSCRNELTASATVSAPRGQCIGYTKYITSMIHNTFLIHLHFLFAHKTTISHHLHAFTYTLTTALLHQLIIHIAAYTDIGLILKHLFNTAKSIDNRITELCCTKQ